MVNPLAPCPTYVFLGARVRGGPSKFKELMYKQISIVRFWSITIFALCVILAVGGRSADEAEGYRGVNT